MLLKKNSFPLNNKKHENTIKYYLGNTKKFQKNISVFK